MKLYLIILAIAIWSITYGQNKQDTTIKKFELHELRNEIYELQKSNKRNEFKIRLLSELDRVDTIHVQKDTLIKKYYSKNNLLIQNEKLIYNLTCVTDSIVTFYNKQGLEEYYCYYKNLYQGDTGILKDNFFLPLYFARHEYDNSGRIIKTVQNAAWQRATVMIFKFDELGNKRATFYRVPINEFWN